MPNRESDNPYQNLFRLFNAIHPLREETMEAIIQQSKVIEVKKKTALLTAGSNCNYIYFIVEGASRVFHVDRNGVETTTWFIFENELLISVYAFFTGKPSLENMETLEDCRMIALRRDQLHKLYSEHMEFNFVGRILTESYYVRNEEQANNLRMLTANERYANLLSKSPQLLNRVSLGNIASYLGISKETLSRVRKKK